MNVPSIGIDLGTSNCVVATVAPDGKPIVLSDEDGVRVQPSMISFLPNGKIIVGKKAKERSLIDPKNSVYAVKRLIGRKFSDPEVQAACKIYPYPIIEGPDGFPRILAQGYAYSVPEISAMVLRRMKQIAEKQFGMMVSKAVITVPANFNDYQRNETKRAGELAGLEVIRMINEPTAAALAYGYNRGENLNLVIYDFGGGTFDVTILRLNKSVFEVLATAGNTFLGGEDIDKRLLDYMVIAFKQKSGMDIANDPLALPRMKALAEQVKCELSVRKKVVAHVKELIRGPEGPVDFSFSITRNGFEERVNDIIDKTFKVCGETLKIAKMQTQEIDCIILVGGSSKIPIIRQRVEAFFGTPAYKDINPDEVVGVGAAIQAAILVQDYFQELSSDILKETPLLLDVTPQSLGVETVGGIMDTIIERNSIIPIEQSRIFMAAGDQQDRVRIAIYQGESRQVSDNLKLGEIVLDGLSFDADRRGRIEVTFEIDTNGIVQVRAKDLAGGVEKSVRLQINASDGRLVESPWSK